MKRIILILVSISIISINSYIGIYIVMALCYLCDKGSKMNTNRKLLRGNYNPTSKKRKYPNLQWVTLISGKKVKACTKCIKTLAKNNK